jgi:hypothetical protein
LLRIYNGEISGIKYSFVEEKEIFEYVDGHGNETGRFDERMVEKVISNDKKYSFLEFKEFLEKNKIKIV